MWFSQCFVKLITSFLHVLWSISTWSPTVFSCKLIFECIALNSGYKYDDWTMIQSLLKDVWERSFFNLHNYTPFSKLPVLEKFFFSFFPFKNISIINFTSLRERNSRLGAVLHLSWLKTSRLLQLGTCVRLNPLS